MKLVFPPIKVSIIIAILDSRWIVKRYLRHFKRMDLPDDIEIILMDDGSDPPLCFPDHEVQNLNIYPTGNKKPWTQPCARNLGAKIALGKYLLMTDIDHILSKEAIMAARDFDGDKMNFPRYFAVLNRGGKIIQDPDTLFRYGLHKRFRERTIFTAGVHTNTFAIKKSIYEELDGYHPKYCEMGIHALHEDNNFYNKYIKYVKVGKYKPVITGPKIYVYPGMAKCKSISEIDPSGLFHKLSRDK